MGQRDREFNWGGDRREGGQRRSSRERVYRSGDNQEDYSGRGGYSGGEYGERERGGGYERSRGREHLGEFPRGGEDRGRRGEYGPREPDMRDMDAFGGYGGRGGGRWGGSESDYDRDRGYGQENRNPYYGGGGLFGGGMGGYTGGGYLGGGFGGSAIDNESEEQRA